MTTTRKKLIPGLVVFLIGLIVTILASLFKIMHWPYSGELLITSALIEIIGIFLIIIALIGAYKSK